MCVDSVRKSGMMCAMSLTLWILRNSVVVQQPHIVRDMNAQADDREGEDDVAVEGATAVGASVFGRPVWPHAYHDNVCVVNHEVWVRERLVEAKFETIGVPEGSPASAFVRDVLAHVDSL